MGIADPLPGFCLSCLLTVAPGPHPPDAYPGCDVNCARTPVAVRWTDRAPQADAAEPPRFTRALAPARLQLAEQAPADGTPAASGADAAPPDMQQQLAIERNRLAAMERDLAAMRERLGEEEHARKAADQAWQHAAAVASGTDARAAALQGQVADEQAKSAGLLRDLAAVRDQLAEEARLRAASDQAWQRATATAVRMKAQLDAVQPPRPNGPGGATPPDPDSERAVAALQKQLGDEKVRAAGLDQALVVARGQLAEASRQRDADRAAATAQDGNRLQAEQDRSATLADKVTRLESVAALKDDLQKRSSERIASLDRALGEAGRQLSADQQAMSALEQGRQHAEADAADSRARLEAEQQRAKDLAETSARLDQAGAQASELQKQLADAQQARSASEQSRQRADAEMARTAAELQAERQHSQSLAEKQTRFDEAVSQIDSLQARVADQERQRIALEDGRQRSDAEAARTTAQLQAERQRSDTLAEKLARLDEAVSQVDGLQAQLSDSERARRTVDDARQRAEAAAADSRAQLQAAQQRAGLLADDLAHMRQATGQAGELQARLAAEQARSADLDHTLMGARQQALEAMRREEAANTARISAEAAQASQDARLRTEQSGAALMAERMASLDAATRRIGDLQALLARQTDRSADLDRQSETLRQTLAEATRRADEADRAKQAAEATAADMGTRLQAEQQQARAAMEQLTRLAPALADEKHRTADLTQQLTEARQRGATARAEAVIPGDAPPSSHGVPEQKSAALVPPGFDAAAPRPTAPAAAAALAPASTDMLPDGIPARIILRYARRSEPARTRATTLVATLRAQGLDVPDPIGTSSALTSTSVIYFYGEDQRSAAQVAKAVAVGRPVQSGIGSDSLLPRPGTIEVLIGG